MDVRAKANEILRNAYGDGAQFRDGQEDAIVSVVNKRKTLVVQKTGWGKSIVYFIATKILRENGSGPSVIISPLLALMKNQVDSAKLVGINAVTINSDNKNDWEDIYSNLNSYDALIISPERLSNEEFMEHLVEIRNIQLFVVDEAHSISDWGHDFRPDYQRIVKLLDNFPANIAILGTTATANDRVIADIRSQIGSDLNIVRGNLIRENLAIQINPSQNREERLAWLVQSLTFDEYLSNGQGIIYCLTQRDCEVVAEFLQKHSINAVSYHSGLDSQVQQQRIEDFDSGKIKILVATIKLGMGYDKSDIRFVIHYQLPSNLIAYYQQIGRAGRDGKKSYAIVLHGREDEEILDFFIESAQAKPELLDEILNCTLYGAKLSDILSKINVKHSKLTEALKYLIVNDYIYKDHSVYRRNPSRAFNSENEKAKQKALNDIRRKELDQLKQYLNISTCLMKFVANELDAPDKNENCNICMNCTGRYLVPVEVDSIHLQLATEYLKNKHGKILPRKQWGTSGNIPINEQYQEGWVLTDDYYSEMGELVKKGKYNDNQFSNELVKMSKEYLKDKVTTNYIDTIVPVPSLRRPNLVPDFARTLSESLGIPFLNSVSKIKTGEEQKALLNGAQQQENIRTTISVNPAEIVGKRILLVDDMVDSRWSFTVISSELLKAGASAVYPFALVKTGNGV